MKQLLLFLFFPLAVFGQTGNTGRSMSGPFAKRPVCSTAVSNTNAHNGDVYSHTDDENVYKCSGGAWWTAGRRRTSAAIWTNPVVYDPDTVHAGSGIYVDIRAYGAYATFSSTSFIDGHSLCAEGTSGSYRDCLTTRTVASGTAALRTSPIAARNCAPVVTTPATDVVTTDAVSYS